MFQLDTILYIVYYYLAGSRLTPTLKINCMLPFTRAPDGNLYTDCRWRFSLKTKAKTGSRLFKVQSATIQLSQ